MLTLFVAVGWTTSANAAATVTKDGTDLKITFEAAGDFNALVGKEDYNYSLPAAYGGATKIIFEGPELNSQDVAQFYRLGEETNKDKIIDLRKVATISSSGWNVGNNLTPDIWFPNGINLEELKSYNTFWTARNFISLSSDGTIINVVGLNKSLDPASASLLTNDTRSLVYYSTATPSSEIYSSLDINGIKNLVLQYADFTLQNSDNIPDFSNIERIILHSGTIDITKFTASDESSVAVYQLGYCPSGSTTVEKEQIHIVKSGGLGKLTDAHYTNSDIENAPCIDILGTAAYTDFEFIAGINNKRINMASLSFDANDTKLKDEPGKKAALDLLKTNTYVNYIALPDVGTETTDGSFKTFFDNMTQLEGVVYYYKDGKSYTCRTKHAGNVSILTAMTASVTGNNVNIENLKLSGSLNAKDISTSGGNSHGTIYFDKDGHFLFDSDVKENEMIYYRPFLTKPEGATDKGAFDGCRGVLKLDLSGATFDYINDMTLSAANILGTNVKVVIIPTSQSVSELPVDFMEIDNNSLEKICIPRNIKKIGARAFRGINTINHITTTNAAGDEVDYGFSKKVHMVTITPDDGSKPYKDQEEVDQSDPSGGTLVFSDALEEIQSYAFATIEKIKDVYCLAKHAPKCHVNAFGSNPLTGNNGYSPTGGITRNDFYKGIDGDGYFNKWIAMLHYPDDIHGTDLEKLYTDVDRDYTISDAEGTTDGYGNLIHWPNQTEFNRSYTQATNGFLWNAWSVQRDPWNNFGSYPLTTNPHGFLTNQKEANGFYDSNTDANSKKNQSIFYYTGYDEATNGTVTQSADPSNANAVDKNFTEGAKWSDIKYNDNGEQKTLYDGDYRGWHQFVLCASFHPKDDGSKDDTPAHNFRNINDNGWWTICVPFDMTKQDVTDLFGQKGNPHVCELTGVIRDEPKSEKDNGSIILQFDRDVYNYVYQTDADGNYIKETDSNGKVTFKVERSTNNGDVVIKKGVPYMLQPDFDMKENEVTLEFAPGKQIMRQEKCKAVPSQTLREYAKGNVAEVEAVDKDGNVNSEHKYSFIGNFWQTEMPQYAYFLAWYEPTLEEYKKAGGDENDYKEGMGYATYFWQKDMPASTLNWNAFTAIIGCNWKEEDKTFFVPTNEYANVHWYTRHLNTESTVSVFEDDSFTSSSTSSAKRGNSPENVSISFGGNTADGITKVHFGDKTIDVLNGKVYNLNGQYVGNSLENLPKGIYIAGGKKYVVK